MKPKALPRVGRARIGIASAEKLPFAADSFDIVYSFGVLRYLPDTAQAIGK